jgi:hypothetical protein
MPFRVTKEELSRVDRQALQGLEQPQRDELLLRLAQDLRHAHDLLSRTPDNSSMPPGSRVPWRGQSGDAGEGAGEEASQGEEDPAQERADTQAPDEGQAGEALPPAAAGEASADKRSAGRQPGAVGHGRTQVLAVDRYEEHRPECCSACGAALPAQGQAEVIGGWDSVEWVRLQSQPSEASTQAGQRLGVRLEVTRHLLLQQRCSCGHVSAARGHVEPPDEQLWPKVALGEQRLLGPHLAAMVVYLSMRMRGSRSKVQELMLAMFGLELSTGLIDQTVREAGRSAERQDEAITKDLLESLVVHADETPWWQWGQTLWLWVMCSLHTALYVIGPRTAQMFANVMDNANFAGILMSDGYAVYREMARRLRCWAHLARKARGLAESHEAQTAQAGRQMLQHIDALMQAVYQARQHKAQQQPVPPHGPQVDAFRRLCEQYQHAPQERVGALAREFLNDWEVIMRPLSEPHLPLTNNHGERQVRHHVIARLISHGTRSDTGTRAYACLASLFDTCRLRGTTGIETLAQTIHAARKGLAIPALPPIPQRLLGWDAVSAA